MQNKHMQKRRPRLHIAGLAILLASVIVGSFAGSAHVRADRYDDQIRILEQQISHTQRSKDHLNVESESLTGAIAGLQAKMTALEIEVQANQTRAHDLENKISAAETELAKERDLLGKVVRANYLESDISTVEMLASSKSLSHFVDRQQYRTSVQNKISSTVERVLGLQAQLKDQKTMLNKLLSDQLVMQTQLATQRNENDRLLSLNQQQRAAYEGEIKQDNIAITRLRTLQAAENARLYASGIVPKGVQGGGDYPAKWALAPMDSIVDTWGMYNRECVSYTAWKIASTGRYMPYWGGVGNAKLWPDNARRAGIPVDDNPRVGDVAISTRGTYGHSMYVETVNSDGTITVSQYNAAWDGNFSTARVYTAGLQFIHF
ncbi:hypothetical protein BH09PAT4_BH09PAT4_00200 [soil metagenome]